MISTFRGATLTLGTAELRVTPFGNHRVGPYGLFGTGIGTARPNEAPRFPGEGLLGAGPLRAGVAWRF